MELSRIGRRQFLALGSSLGVAVALGSARAESQRRLYLQPLGSGMPEGQVRIVEQALMAFYAVEVRRLDRVALPRSAFYPPRSRYRADKLLDFLGPRLPQDGHRILGITSVDISTTKDQYPDWGVLGLANVAGTACVLSSFRCRRGAKSARQILERFGKVAVHEIGHTFGLPHCTATPGCLMEDAHGTVKTTDAEFDLCVRCRATLQRRGYALATGDPPWKPPA